MPNILDENGLTTKTEAELLSYFTQKYQEIYGTDINLESNTPDGQMMRIFIQTILDIQDLLTQVYNSFDPDTAIGTVLDQRVAINGIQRQGGTYTITNITIVNTTSINLYGLDQEDEDVYTVADNEGNRWFLMETQLGITAGSHVYAFRAEFPGQVFTIPNTITVQDTIVLGVSSVNNPTTYTTLGENEETDAALRLRRQRSVSLASQGYLPGLLAALENIPGVTSAFVYENNTDSTDINGVPSHSIWVIVAGSGADEDIAEAIYKKRNGGCGMYGSVTYNIVQIDGTPFTVRWDIVQSRTLFIKFTATSIDGVIPPAVGPIRTGLDEDFLPGVNDSVNINELSTLVQDIDPNTLVTNAGFSLAETQTLDLDGIPASGTFKLKYGSEETGTLNWNDSAGTIETAIQGLTGLSNTTVSGSLSGQQLVFDLSGEADVSYLIYVVDNTLETAGTDPIAFAYSIPLSNVLPTPTKRDQFIVSEPNIIILNVALSPSATSVAVTQNVNFSAAGGYGEYEYYLDTDNSGASIDPVTGVYTAGSTPSVTDVVGVRDALGNTATASVMVVN